MQADEESGILYDFGAMTIDCTSASVTPAPATVDVGSAATTLTVPVTGTSGCGWNATPNVAWLDSLSSGVGDGYVAVTIEANPTLSARTGTISVGNATITVNQAALVPTSTTAKAYSPASVSVSWSSPGVDHFEIWRSSGGAFTLVGTTAAPPFNDTTVAADTGYAYKVRAVVTGGGTSQFGSADYAHTYSFEDLSLTGTTIRAVHLTQLRTAINAMRTAAGMSAATFTDPSLAAVVAKRVHITELRDALNALRSQVGLSAFPFPTLVSNSTILAQTTEDLRTAAQ